MNESKRKSLEVKGWEFGDAADFLELTPEECAVIERKLNTK